MTPRILGCAAVRSLPAKTVQSRTRSLGLSNRLFSSAALLNRLVTMSVEMPLTGTYYCISMGVPDLDAVERRSEPRIRMGKQPVLVDPSDGREHVTCYICDISRRGACIITPPGICLPYSFKIFVEGRWRNVVTVWDRWPQVGMQFVK